MLRRGLARGAAEMGRNDQIVHAQQWMVARQRLWLSDIEGGGVNPFFAQSFDEGIMVDHAAARHVDQDGRRFHHFQLFAPDHAPRFGRQRHV